VPRALLYDVYHELSIKKYKQKPESRISFGYHVRDAFGQKVMKKMCDSLSVQIIDKNNPFIIMTEFFKKIQLSNMLLGYCFET